MKNILVVDDEAIQRRVLSGMIRNVRPDCTVFEAGNGQKALELMSLHPIDVIVTDIKMPIMDGFEFIERSNTGQQPKIVILSGYRYFEYAQKALRLGAFDYLVKPVKEESIIHMLEKVEESIRQDRTRHLEKEQLTKQLDYTLPVYYNLMLNDWISGRLTQTKLEELKSAFPLHPKGAVIVSRIRGDSYQESGHLEQLKSAMRSKISSSLMEFGPSVSFFSIEDKQVMITLLTMEHPSDTAWVLCTGSLLAFCNDIKEQYGAELAIGIGNERCEIWNEASESYQEAIAAETYRFYLVSEPIIRYAELPSPVPLLGHDLSKEEEALKELIRQMKSEALIEQLHGIFDKIIETGYPVPHQLKKQFVHLTYNLAAVIKDFVEEAQYRRWVMELEIQITECSDFEQFKQRIADHCVDLISILQSAKARKHEVIIEKCIAYIDSHYMEELSLEAVASRFYFSPNYLSMVFKNHLGSSFVKYLSGVRLAKAVAMLECGELKVYEIAARTGFKDDKYFYRVFKRKYGITPDEYRRNNMVLSNTDTYLK